MANGDCSAIDENLLHQQAQDLLTLTHIECLRAGAQLSSKSRQRLCYLQIPCFVYCGHFQRMQFGFDSLHLPAQLGHTMTQLRQRYQTFLIGIDQTLDTFLQSGLFTP